MNFQCWKFSTVNKATLARSRDGGEFVDSPPWYAKQRLDLEVRCSWYDAGSVTCGVVFASLNGWEYPASGSSLRSRSTFANLPRHNYHTLTCSMDLADSRTHGLLASSRIGTKFVWFSSCYLDSYFHNASVCYRGVEIPWYWTSTSRYLYENHKSPSLLHPTSPIPSQWRNQRSITFQISEMCTKTILWQNATLFQRFACIQEPAQNLSLRRTVLTCYCLSFETSSPKDTRKYLMEKLNRLRK